LIGGVVVTDFSALTCGVARTGGRVVRINQKKKSGKKQEKKKRKKKKKKEIEKKRKRERKKITNL